MVGCPAELRVEVRTPVLDEEEQIEAWLVSTLAERCQEEGEHEVHHVPGLAWL